MKCKHTTDFYSTSHKISGCAYDTFMAGYFTISIHLVYATVVFCSQCSEWSTNMVMGTDTSKPVWTKE